MILTLALLATTPVIAFSKLGPNEQIELIFESKGCFSSSRYDLTFTKPGMRVRVAAKDASGASIGSMSLSSEQVKKLDNLLVFYRTAHKEEWSPRDTLKFRLIGNGLLKRAESYTDSSSLTVPVKLRQQLGLSTPNAMSMHDVLDLLRARAASPDPVDADDSRTVG